MRNRFKGLDLIDRVPDKSPKRPSPRKRNAKRLSKEALQIVVKRREAKSKGKKERYTFVNAEFQRITRRDKKAFLSDQCKEIEENNRMGKTRDLFKKIRDTNGEGNGTPLQYCCLENPMDGGAWWAAVHRVAQSWTQKK